VYVGNNPVNYVDPTGHMPHLVKNITAQVYGRSGLPSGVVSAAVIGYNMVNGNSQELFNSFHDIAQINIVKALNGNALVEVGLTGTRVDVVGSGAQAWEVKPLGGESAEPQLLAAEANGLRRGKPLAPISGIEMGVPNLYMRIDFPAPGEARYSFYKHNAKGQEVRVSSVGATITIGAWMAAGFAVAGTIGGSLPLIEGATVTLPALETLLAP